MNKEKQINEITNELIFTNNYGTLDAVAKHLYESGYRKQSEVIDEFVKRLLDAFPEANRDNRCPAIYYDDYRYIIEELAEEMKGGVK